jgi:metallo-beta-lactamase family protein
MKITILGAGGGEVTGSAFLVQTNRARVLVECGMYQGGKKSEALNRPPTGPRQKLDAVLVTHGHLDHTGRLPLLARMGYQNPVYATAATLDMTALILRDSARIQEGDAMRQNRKRERSGEPPVEPLYSITDTETIIQYFRPAHYGKPVQVAPGIQAHFTEAGHMLGSSSILLNVEEDGRQKRILFSGDLGPQGNPILPDASPIRSVDMVFMESTYGDRDHRPFQETMDEFIDIVKDAIARKGKILIPTFAIGRAQLLTILLSWAFRKNRLKPFPLFLDSPMAIEASRIYANHFLRTPELFDERVSRYVRQRPIREDLRTLKATRTVAESMEINNVSGPCLIMAGAGMCNAGRILHHLKANLWKPETHVLIVGYQAHGSLGRMLVEGERQVRIFGEKILVRAQIHTLGGFSAHAGQKDLLAWFEAIAPSNPRLVLIHGEKEPRETLAKLIRQKHGIEPIQPDRGEIIELDGIKPRPV